VIFVDGGELARVERRDSLADILADPRGKAVTILWEANDKNLTARPIALSWARTAGGPWQPIVSQLENTGQYVWKLPAGVPPRIWVRVEAEDLAGNLAVAETPDAISPAPRAVAADDRPQSEVAVRAVQPAAAVIPAPPPSPAPAQPEGSHPGPRVQMLKLEPAQ